MVGLRVAWALVPIGALLGSACGPQAHDPAAGSSSGAGPSSSASPGDSTAAIDGSTSPTASTDAATAATGGTSTGPVGPYCGDGIVDPDERCDGPAPDGTPCSADCQYSGWWCDGLLRDCGNAEDDDGDGLIDLDDPDCISPCDDTEDSLDPDQVGDSADPDETDCYWDANNGSGDDGCRYKYSCDPLSPGGPLFPYDPALPCMEPLWPECLDSCLPMTPNGCDCFGCCEYGGTTMFLGFPTGPAGMDPCTAANPELCNPCTIVTECFNPCDAEACELCWLQSIEDLAPGCREPACAPGVVSCTSSYECPPDTSCKTGCCVPYQVQ